ncbi:MAG: class I SAM-dependent methyltransferase [Hyphomicrobiales bacterium]|jgi:SAM-dependent methyltransferase|nr:class I SAM-dependent methyltransferase [Hyphomicrobiales bacterium]
MLKRLKGLWTKARASDPDEMTAPPGVPPAHLRKRVHGSDDIAGYENVGRIVATTVFSHLNINRDAAPFRGLDFGSGSGRVLIPLHELCLKHSTSGGTIEWFGSDVDRQAIAWAQKNLSSIATFVVNEPMPPLPFPDQFFDFIFSISVFTHIPEDMQFAWLAELSRVLKIGGSVLISTLSLDLLKNKLSEAEFRKGFYYIDGGKGTDGLPRFYRDTHHSHEYIEREWSRYFSIEAFNEKGIADHQDLVLCKRVK